jgi:hypothetical protein
MSKRRNRPGRMMTREQRAADRAAITAHEAEIGPDEVLRRADVATIDACQPGMSSRAVDIAQSWLAETEDPGWGLDRAMLARQYRRLTGRALSADEAENASEDPHDYESGF